MAHEVRNNYCWSCKYFGPDDDTQTPQVGHCYRRAPTRNAYDTQTTAGNMDMFAKILDARIVQCGEYVRMEGTIPDVPA